jgi:hypothetical protein
VIIFDLRCSPAGHVFEAWFGSSGDYADQQARGLVSCPICGAGDVAKAPMAPAVPKKGGGEAASNLMSANPAAVKEMLGALAIHLGEADARLIHGRATSEQAQSLAEDGIPVAPLPFPVAPPGEEN